MLGNTLWGKSNQTLQTPLIYEQLRSLFWQLAAAMTIIFSRHADVGQVVAAGTALMSGLNGSRAAVIMERLPKQLTAPHTSGADSQSATTTSLACEPAWTIAALHCV